MTETVTITLGWRTSHEVFHDDPRCPHAKKANRTKDIPLEEALAQERTLCEWCKDPGPSFEDGTEAEWSTLNRKLRNGEISSPADL